MAIKQIVRMAKSAATKIASGAAAHDRPLPARVDGAVALQDQELGWKRRPVMSTLGVPGTPIVSGFIQDLGEYNPELQGRNAIPIYEKMRRGDAQVRATLQACKLPVLAAHWRVEPGETAAEGEFAVSSNGQGRATARKSKEIAQFVKESLFGGLEWRTAAGGLASQTWSEVVRNALLMLDFGCAVHEEVWRVDGGRIRLRRLASRLPLTFYRWLTEPDGETLVALEQYGYRGSEFVTARLPADKCAIFTYQQEGANFWGLALSRAMYPHWYVKNQLYRIDAIACERNSLGIPVYRLPPGFSEQDRQAAYTYVTQLAAHEGTGLVEPPGDAGTGLRIVGYEGRVRDLQPSIEHHNVMISRAALALFMDLGQAPHGSRALGSEHQDFFLLALQSLADQVAATITATTVRRLVAYNFGEDAPLPCLRAANVQARGLGELVDTLTQLAGSGLVVSEANLRRFIREELALPEESGRGLVAVKGETVSEPGEQIEGKGAEPVESVEPVENQR